MWNGEGLTNLPLMKTLYWLFALVLIAVGYGNMPLSKQLKQGFPENTVIGKMCLQIEDIFSEESFKSRILGFIFPFLNLIFAYWWQNRSYRYISKQFLNQTTFSGLGGKYRRNIFTFEENLSYNSNWCLFIMVENSLLIVLEQYSEHISKEVRYNLHNIMCIVFIDLFHGLYLPLKHMHACQNHFSSSRKTCKNTTQITKFYVRDPEIVPKRDHHNTSITISSTTKKENRRRRKGFKRKNVQPYNMALMDEIENKMPSVCD